MSESIVSAFVKNQLLVLGPIGRRRSKRLLDVGYVPAKNSVDYVTAVFRNCAAQVTAHRPISGSVLEIGPGGNVATTLLFLEAGAERGVCIDVFPFLSDQGDLYAELTTNPHALDRIEYRCPEAIETTTLPAESFDIIFSNACLEHVSDPAVAAKRISTLLKPGGVTTHGIDLRDHRNFDEPLDFLRYPDWVWRGASSRRTHTNRWRASDWQKAFREAGLTDIEIKPVETHDLTEPVRRSMNRRFRDKRMDDLALTQIELTAIKPHRREPSSAAESLNS